VLEDNQWHSAGALAISLETAIPPEYLIRYKQWRDAFRWRPDLVPRKREMTLAYIVGTAARTVLAEVASALEYYGKIERTNSGNHRGGHWAARLIAQ
jgi:hypothetical protein